MANQETMRVETIHEIYDLAEEAIQTVLAAYRKMVHLHKTLSLLNSKLPDDSVLHLLGNDQTYEERMDVAYSTIVQAVDEMSRAAAGRPTKEEETALHDAELTAVLATQDTDI